MPRSCYVYGALTIIVVCVVIVFTAKGSFDDSTPEDFTKTVQGEDGESFVIQRTDVKFPSQKTFLCVKHGNKTIAHRMIRPSDENYDGICESWADIKAVKGAEGSMCYRTSWCIVIKAADGSFTSVNYGKYEEKAKEDAFFERVLTRLKKFESNQALRFLAQSFSLPLKC